MATHHERIVTSQQLREIARQLTSAAGELQSVAAAMEEAAHTELTVVGFGLVERGVKGTRNFARIAHDSLFDAMAVRGDFGSGTKELPEKKKRTRTKK